MCDVVTAAVVMGTLSLASGVMGHMAAEDQAEASEDYAAAAQRNAYKAAHQAHGQESLRQLQEGEAAAEDRRAHSMEAQRAAAAATTHFGESGLSADTLLADIQRQDALYRQTVNQNLLWSNLQSENRMEAQSLQAVSTSQAAASRVLARPSWLVTGLEIGTQIAGNPATQQAVAGMGKGTKKTT